MSAAISKLTYKLGRKVCSKQEIDISEEEIKQSLRELKEKEERRTLQLLEIKKRQ